MAEAKGYSFRYFEVADGRLDDGIFEEQYKTSKGRRIYSRVKDR